MRIAVVGSGYVGTVVAACMATIGHEVQAVEVDAKRLESLRSAEVPFFEPGLEPLLEDGLHSGRLSFFGNFESGLVGAEIIFLCVGTPGGANGDPDMQHVEAAAREIGRYAERGAVLVTKSTVPIGSGAWLANLMAEFRPEVGNGGISVVSNPEFLREGSAVHDYLHPARVVLGGSDAEAIDRVARAYAPILEQTHSAAGPDHKPELVITDVRTAETVKYAANAFLATKISFMNEVAHLADAVGADVTDVARAMGLDPRIGAQFLGAGVGWGGSCFGKDLSALAGTARRYGIEPAILEAVRNVNAGQIDVAIQKLHTHLGSLDGAKIALFGLAFKPGTDDLRDAPSLKIAEALHARGAVVAAYDPVVREVNSHPELSVSIDAYDAAAGADAVVLVTEWPELVDLDFERVSAVMAGELLLDGRNALQPARVQAAGLTYVGIGRGSA
jgi:nucleotide sugar dehydrogenase